MKIKKIGLILAGRRDAHRTMTQRFFSPPFTAPLCLRTVGGIITAVRDDIELLLFDENLLGEVTDKFIKSVDICFFSGLSTSHFGVRRGAQKARRLGKIVIVGGMGVTCFYAQDPVNNAAEMNQWFDGACIGRLTTRLCQRILSDCENGTIQPLYMAEPDEPVEHICPRHDLGQGRYWFNAVLTSSNGCSSNCGFCVVHHCLPGGKRGTFFPKPIALIAQELDILDRYSWFFDAADSFGEDPAHTFGDGENPLSGILPLYRDRGKRWVTEVKVEMLKGDGDWRLLNEIAKAHNAVTYIGIEDLWHRFTKKQASKEDIEEAIKRGRDLGLVMIGSIILDGSSQTTPEDVRRTIDWCTDVEMVAEFQFSDAACIDGSDFKRVALKNGTLIDNNPEFTDGAWPQFERPNLTPEFRINALMEAYKKVYSLDQLISRLRRRGITNKNAWLAALVGLGIHHSAKKWAAKKDYSYWLEHHIKPGEPITY